MSRPEAMAQAFIAAAHRMTAEHELAKLETLKLTAEIVRKHRDLTQSRADFELCNKLLEGMPS